MAKEFYTERDIEDLAKRGVMSIRLGDNVVLTELAFEKAGRLGVKLERDSPAGPPSAPVRPYISQAQPRDTTACRGAPPAPAPAGADLAARVRSAVTAKLGAQIDPALLDVIIQRVLKSTGVK